MRKRGKVPISPVNRCRFPCQSLEIRSLNGKKLWLGGTLWGKLTPIPEPIVKDPSARGCLTAVIFPARGCVYTLVRLFNGSLFARLYFSLPLQFFLCFCFIIVVIGGRCVQKLFRCRSEALLLHGDLRCRLYLFFGGKGIVASHCSRSAHHHVVYSEYLFPHGETFLARCFQGVSLR